MMEYFTFDGVSSADFNAYLANSNMFDAPKKDVTAVTIPGRNGTLHIDNGRFEEFRLKVTVYIPSHLRPNIDGLRNYLMSKGTCRYMETYRPNEYRMATFVDAFSVNNSDRHGAYFDLIFDASPERWLLSGERAIDVASPMTIYNNQLYSSKPLIEVVGNGTIWIGESEIVLVNNSGKTFIDCETMNAYEGTQNKNPWLTVSEWAKLKPGANEISFEGFTSVKIYPRWWTV